MVLWIDTVSKKKKRLCKRSYVQFPPHGKNIYCHGVSAAFFYLP